MRVKFPISRSMVSHIAKCLISRSTVYHIAQYGFSYREVRFIISRSTVLNVNVVKFNQARVNGGMFRVAFAGSELPSGA